MWLTAPRRLPTRKPLRLPGWDYAQASTYMVSIAVDGTERRFGEITDFHLRLNDAGSMVEEIWTGLLGRFPSIGLDAFVVMPNHFHGIVFIGTEPDLDPPSLSRVIQAFKSITAVEYGRGVRIGSYPAVKRGLWQRGFYDSVLGTERALNRARLYNRRQSSNVARTARPGK